MDEDQVLITGLEVDGRPVGIGDKINGQTVLAEGISYTSSITLNNENRDFLFYLLIIFLMLRNNRSTITAYYHIRRIGWFLMMERRLLI